MKMQLHCLEWKKSGTRRHRHAPAIRQPVRCRPRPELLEDRIVLSVPTPSAGQSDYEVYAWSVINRMRSNPASFGTELDNVLYHGAGSFLGLSSSDPFWEDLRSKNDAERRKEAAGTWRYGEWLGFIKSQNYQLGPLALDPNLSQGAYNHNVWMTIHTYGHSISVGDPVSKAESHGSLPGFPQPGIKGDPDRVRLGSFYDGAWGENIGYTVNALPASYQAFRNGKLSENGYYTRLALYETLSYIIDWGNPGYGHLLNLLADDRSTGTSLGLTSSGPKNKSIQRLNAIGIDLFYNEAAESPKDNVARSMVSTHRFARAKPYSDGGGYVVVQAFEDLNGDGFYTPGLFNGRPEAPSINVSYIGATDDPLLGLGGSAITLTGTNHGVYCEYLPNGTYTFTISSGSKAKGTYKVIGTYKVRVKDRNVLIDARYSSGFGLVDAAGEPVMTADLYEPNDSQAQATDLGAFSPRQPHAPRSDGLSIDNAADQDWFRFVVQDTAANANILVGFDPRAGNLDAVLYRADAAGKLTAVTPPTASGDGKAFNLSLAPGTYYLKVSSPTGATNFYALTVDLNFPEPAPSAGNTLANAAPTGLSGATGSYLLPTAHLGLDDVNLFRINARAGTTVNVVTQPTANGRPTDTLLRVFDANGREIATADDTPTSAYAALSFIAPRSGDYFIGVSGFENVAYDPLKGTGRQSQQDGDYQLGINLVAGGTDYDGDGRTDLAVFRRVSEGEAATYIAGGITPPGGSNAFGSGTLDVPLQGDLDGDGKTDLILFRPSTGQWFTQQSSNGFAQYSFGGPGDIAAVGDFDGVGHDQLAVYRPSTGQWFVGGHGGVYDTFGGPEDIPIPLRNYYGNGRDVLAVFRPSTAQWFVAGQGRGISFGGPGDIPVALYNYWGDGRDNLAVFRPSTAQWFVGGLAEGISFGGVGDVPIALDYDGIGKTQIGVYRPGSGQWFIAGHGDAVVSYGGPADIPLAAPYAYRALPGSNGSISGRSSLAASSVLATIPSAALTLKGQSTIAMDAATVVPALPSSTQDGLPNQGLATSPSEVHDLALASIKDFRKRGRASRIM